MMYMLKLHAMTHIALQLLAGVACAESPADSTTCLSTDQIAQGDILLQASKAQLKALNRRLDEPDNVDLTDPPRRLRAAAKEEEIEKAVKGQRKSPHMVEEKPEGEREEASADGANEEKEEQGSIGASQGETEEKASEKEEEETEEEKVQKVGAETGSADDLASATAWGPQPPLKDPAWKADENYIKDDQPKRKDFEEQALPVSANPLSRFEIMASMHLAVALMLLGFLTMVIALFYLVNFPDEDIRQATWRLLSTTLSIFLAVLIFSVTQEFLACLVAGGRYVRDAGVSASKLSQALDPGEVGHSSPITNQVVYLTFGRFLILWMMLQFWLYYHQSRVTALKAIGKLGCHVVAFAGMDAFGTLQDSWTFFQSSVALSFVAVALTCIFIWAIFNLADSLRTTFAERSAYPQARQDWLHECRLAEHEAAGLILGLLLSQSIRFCISGYHPPLHGGAGKGHGYLEVFVLFLTALCLGAMVVPLEIIFARLKQTYREQANSRDWVVRFIRATRETLSMTMAWCLVYWARWAFWFSTADDGLGYGDKMTALLTIALCLSFVCFGGVFIIDIAAGNMARNNHGHNLAALVALGNALGLVMGLAWESTFHEAVTGISQLQSLSFGYTINNIILICIIILIVLPAWILYILPQAINCQQDDKAMHLRHKELFIAQDFPPDRS